MRHSLVIATALTAALLGGTSAFAADWTGFYFGIYSGASLRSATAFNGTVIDVQYGVDGGIEYPNGFTNANGVDATAFALLNQTVGQYVAGADATADIGSGTLNYGPGASIGWVTGYSFGNGVRVETDYSGTFFQFADLLLAGFVHQTIDGDYPWPPPAPPADPEVWIWNLLNEQNLSGGSTDIKANSTVVFALANAWYDFDNDSTITPYVGGGLGMANVITTFQSDTGSASSSVFVPAAQLGAGITVDLGDTAFLDLGSRVKVAASSSSHASGITDLGNLHFTGYDITTTGPLVVYTLQAGLNVRIQ